MSKRTLSLLLPLILIGVLQIAPVGADVIPDEQYEQPAMSSDGPMVGAFFLDNILNNMPGSLQAFYPPGQTVNVNGVLNLQTLCTSVDDAACDSSIQFQYLAHLPRCVDSLALDCVVGIFAVKSDGTRVDGTFLRGIPEPLSNPFTGNASLGLPQPGPDSLWKIAGVLNGSGSDTYLANATLSGTASKSAGKPLVNPFALLSFSAGIFPVKVVSGVYVPGYVGYVPGSSGPRSLGTFPPTGPGVMSCAIVSTSECDLREAFPPTTEFGLTLRLSQELGGWLHGRVRDPQITYISSGSGTSLSVQALPVAVPIVATWTNRSNLPAVLPGDVGNPLPNTAVMGRSFGDGMMSLLQTWLPIVKDTAQANPTEWVVRNLSSSEMQGANSCISASKTLAGFVSTNSTTYSAGPPKFNPATESLDYKLVSPHFTSKGEVFKGVYTLAIRSDVARCIYEFTNAPIKATISVTDDSGTSNVAVESMSEHDGWIYLSASNFEFSSPTVHVKLSQDAPAIPVITPSPSASATPSPHPTTVMKKIVAPSVKKTSITCMKGKTVKKISGISPKCPTGYKKK